MDLEAKVVVVTGAAGGIGGALVRGLLERDAKSVIAADLDGRGVAAWLAFTYGAQGVRVSCICPGAVDTAMLRAGAAGDAARASAVIGGGDVLTPAAAAQRILDAVAEDRFLILTHPEMQDFMVGK